ncbi:MAG: hypothetical protein ACYTXY_05690 [Nostoc sp.]
MIVPQIRAGYTPPVHLVAARFYPNPTNALPEAVPSPSSVSGAILLLPTKRDLMVKALPIDRH